MNQPYIHPAPDQPQMSNDQIPKETLYVRNLNDRIKLEDMKFILFALFSQYGDLIQITMKQSNKLRGQAFLVFQNVTYATNAKAALNGMVIFGNPMQVEFSKLRSEIFDQMEGKIYYKNKQQNQQSNNNNNQQSKDKKTKKIKIEDKSLQSLKNPLILTNDADANNVIIAEDLPEILTEAVLASLFQQYPGCQQFISPINQYRNVRLIQSKKLAFIEYSNEDQAVVALRGLNGFKLSETENLKLKFARKDQ